MTETAEAVQQLRERFQTAREMGSAAEVRAAAVAYHRCRREQGATQEVVANELGLKKWTLAKWIQNRDGAATRAAQSKSGSPSAETSEHCAALRQEIDALGPRNPARRFPEELKQRITQRARGALEEGVAPKEVAELLGVPWESLSRWLGRRGPPKVTTSKKLRAVSVVEHAPSAPTGTRLKSPSGYVVEGLDVGMLVELLRQLG